jgi:sulfite reductase beta subunit-like hemoprotein
VFVHAAAVQYACALLLIPWHLLTSNHFTTLQQPTTSLLLDVLLLLLQLPNGEVTSEQLRYAASIIRKYGKDGCADITTRANLQLRGVKLEDADGVIEGLIQHGMGSFQSGMDSVRNLTGSPIAGLDPHELFDTRWACY